VKFSIFFLFVIILTLSSIPAETPADNLASLQTKLEKMRIKHAIPGASIAIISKEKILQPISLGWANLNKKIPVGSDTLFQACSLTKTLTSALVLVEFKRRKLSLDIPVNQFLKRWKIPKNKFPSQLTTRMLLNHTGAVSDPYPDGGAKFSKQKATLREHFLGQFPALNPPLSLQANPGDTYRYCNGCYSILQMVIEDITGRDYRDLIKEVLLDPIGMKKSIFSDTLLDSQHENVALNYDDTYNVYAPQRKLPIYATGGLWSTAGDMALFIREMQKGLAGKSFILSQQIARDLVTPDSTSTRGLGFFIGDRFVNEKPGGNYFFHGGQNIGYLAMMVGSIDGESGAVVMINISSPWNSKKFPHFAFVDEVIQQIATDPANNWP
jgi:CubicO group peptidase (beta-lactamase class C family)